MDNGVRISADAMSRQEKKYDLVAHNAANIGTDYFKEVMLSYEADSSGVIKSVNSFAGEQGVLRPTADNMAFALSEKNYIKAADAENNLFYLKTGKFSVSSEGNLMSGTYSVLDAGNRPVSVSSAEDFYVDESGYITENGVASGRLGIAELGDAIKLEQAAPGVFKSEGVTEEDPGQGVLIKQGFIEASNVNRGRQVMNMISVVRQYEASQKALIVNDEAVSRAINELGKF